MSNTAEPAPNNVGELPHGMPLSSPVIAAQDFFYDAFLDRLFGPPIHMPPLIRPDRDVEDANALTWQDDGGEMARPGKQKQEYTWVPFGQEAYAEAVDAGKSNAEDDEAEEDDEHEGDEDTYSSLLDFSVNHDPAPAAFSSLDIGAPFIEEHRPAKKRKTNNSGPNEAASRSKQLLTSELKVLQDQHQAVTAKYQLKLDLLQAQMDLIRQRLGNDEQNTFERQVADALRAAAD